MAEAAAIEAPLWTLSALADETGFNRHIELVTSAIADRHALKVHVNIVAERRAYAAWVAALQVDDRDPIDYRTFVKVCASLITSIAGRRTIAFSAMVREPGASGMIDLILKYPNEITALAAGAALYAVRAGTIGTGTASTGANIVIALSPMIVENAAASLRQHGEAAALRFRELLQLGTPWT
jgi:hypothetical protein